MAQVLGVSAFVSLIYLLHRDLCDVGADAVFCTVLEHFFGFSDTTDQRVGDLFARADIPKADSDLPSSGSESQLGLLN